ncbi:hypothetical protein HPB48_026250 [Haemaphysalis longicornis]|uniref:Cytochrome P450 n=1 Tax=Haemaphysalis longicornis TaxID=44386 RepID=A0A9J6HBF1_HAELO|nr:hypothetical protein HPB48_026250 [Haemaphysalis longicornis]
MVSQATAHRSHEECRCHVEKIAEADGGHIAIQEYVVPSISNIIMALVYGRRLPSDHPDRRRLDQLFCQPIEFVGAGTLVEFLYPILRKIVSKLPSSRRNAYISGMGQFIEYAKKQVDQHNRTIDPDVNHDFIDGYLKKIKEHERDPDSNFLRKYFGLIA